jgi:hypothetical protein
MKREDFGDTFLMTKTEMVLETLVYTPFNHLTRMLSGENFMGLSLMRSRDGSVSVLNGLTGWTPVESWWLGTLISKISRASLGLTQPPIHWVPQTLSPTLKRPGLGANHSSLSGTEVKNECAVSWSGGYPPVFYRRGPGSIPGQFVWDLWWTKWHWDRVFPEYFSFLL